MVEDRDLQNRFRFEGAISNAFKAVKPVQYLVVMPLIYAGVITLIYAIGLYLMRDLFGDFMANAEALENAGIDEDDPGAVFSAMFALMAPFLPWVIGLSLVTGVVWSVFTAAGMRRYVRDESFRLGFGMDEIRIMGVAILWYLLMTVLYILPFLLIFSSIWGIVSEAIVNGDTMTPAQEDALAMKIGGSMAGAFGLMIILFPLYVFLATRFSPAFALTIKKRKFAFIDAWNVSRGRFWPILGAFVILAVGGGMAVGIVDQIFQMILMLPLMGAVENAENIQSGEEFAGLFLRAGFLVPLGIYMVLTVALRFALEHASHGPAAYAARHDPRGSVDDEMMLQNFE